MCHLGVSHLMFGLYFDYSLQILVILASWVFPDLKLEWLVRETKRNLPCELNFMMEGENAGKTARLLC